MGYTKKKKHTRKNKRLTDDARGGSGKTNINIGFHAPALGMITKGNSKFKDYDGDKLTSIVNMTHDDSINNLVDNVDEILASIVYGKNEQYYPQPVYKKHISIQVPPFGRTDDIPRPDIGTGIPPVPDSFPPVSTDTPTAITITDGCASGSTHYKTLGVDADATIEQIRKAYKIKSRQCHPDKIRGNINATTQQTEINNAKDILIDVEKRKQYDEYLHNQGGNLNTRFHKSKKRKIRKSKIQTCKRQNSKK